MFHSGSRSSRPVRRAFVVALVVLCSAVGAAAASAASLSIHVPSKVKKGKDYAIDLRGSFKKSQTTGKAFVISLIQFSSRPCRASAQAENRLKHVALQFYFAPNSDPRRGSVGIFERKSPFRRTDAFKAGSAGVRQVCAYLYPKKIGPDSRVAPIARADARYKVTAS
jgi:hypothetical protein